MGIGSSSDSGEQPNKKIKTDQDQGSTLRATPSASRQTKILILDEGELYTLSIGNYLTAIIEGGYAGSFRITGEVVNIHDSEGNLVFSGQMGDLITIEDVEDDDERTSAVIAESGGSSSDESNVEIYGGNMQDVTFTSKGSGTAPKQQKSLQDIGSKTSQNTHSSSNNSLGVVPRNTVNQEFEPNANVQGGLIAQTPKTLGLVIATRLPQTETDSLPDLRQ